MLRKLGQKPTLGEVNFDSVTIVILMAILKECINIFGFTDVSKKKYC